VISLNFDLDVIKAGSTLVSGIRKMTKSIGVAVAHRSGAKLVTLERAVEDFFSAKTGPGDVVSIDGFLSKYILSHRTHFYSCYAHRVTEHSVRPSMLDPFQNKVSLTIGAQPTQLPIQAIPPIRSGEVLVHVYFLYPPDIRSFLLAEDPARSQQKEKGIDVETLLELPGAIRPILVVSPKPLYEETEKNVRLTGVLARIDADISDTFLNNMSGTQQAILSNTIRPFAAGIGTLGLDLRTVAKLEVKGVREEMLGTLYVETHLEDIARIPNYQKIVGASFPGAFPGLHWYSYGDEPVSWGLSTSKVYIASIGCSRFAFFIETNLCDDAAFQGSLKELHGFTELFRKKVQNFARQAYNIELRNKYDFIFDYSKSKLFHPNGVLVSKEIENFLAHDPELADDINWLRTGQ
jgi:hypothetical protein